MTSISFTEVPKFESNSTDDLTAASVVHVTGNPIVDNSQVNLTLYLGLPIEWVIDLTGTQNNLTKYFTIWAWIENANGFNGPYNAGGNLINRIGPFTYSHQNFLLIADFLFSAWQLVNYTTPGPVVGYFQVFVLNPIIPKSVLNPAITNPNGFLLNFSGVTIDSSEAYRAQQQIDSLQSRVVNADSIIVSEQSQIEQQIVKGNNENSSLFNIEVIFVAVVIVSEIVTLSIDLYYRRRDAKAQLGWRREDAKTQADFQKALVDALLAHQAAGENREDNPKSE